MIFIIEYCYIIFEKIHVGLTLFRLFPNPTGSLSDIHKIISKIKFKPGSPFKPE